MAAVEDRPGRESYMAADFRIMTAWDRASAPISRYFELIGALASGRDEREIARGFRSLDKDLSATGIRSENPALYRAGRPITFALVTAMIDDLAARIAVASERIREALEELRDRLEKLNARSSRFARVGANSLAL